LALLQPPTLFMGQRQVFLPVCGSTNTEAQQLLLKNDATEGTVVFTEQQTAGKGQRGNTWESEPGQNLTASFILRPTFLPVQDQFYLTIAISLAVADLLEALQIKEVRIKWPNDILVEDRKLAGILTECSLSGSSVQNAVVGIGVNVNQRFFTLPQAVSLFQITGRYYEVNKVLEQLCAFLEKRYLQLRQGLKAELKRSYLQQLYRYQEPAMYRFNGQEQSAVLVGVEESGLLALDVGGKLQHFAFKEVTFV
jgi:BirA family biotin operon repressor/biotin-[acetyl-CoA-carboxylase] ligase